jgi:hypothetical protein
MRVSKNYGDKYAMKSYLMQMIISILASTTNSSDFPMVSAHRTTSSYRL